MKGKIVKKTLAAQLARCQKPMQEATLALLLHAALHRQGYRHNRDHLFAHIAGYRRRGYLVRQRWGRHWYILPQESLARFQGYAPSLTQEDTP